MHDIQAGAGSVDLPVFGCAVSKRLKDLVDPIAIKR
jgi:hypothetical protein